MSQFIAIVSYLGFRLALLPFQIGSLQWARALGAGLGIFAYYFLPIRKAVVRRNLTAYFGDAWDEAQLRAATRNAYKYAGIAVSEFAFGQRFSNDNIERYVQVENPEYYHQAHASGRPVIFYGAHQTMWEWSISIRHWFPDPFFVVMKRIHNDYLNAYLGRRRAVFGVEFISQRGAVGVLESKADVRGVNYGFFVDQRAAKGKGVWINIRGNAVSAMAGPAVLAVRYGGLALLPVQMIRTKTGIVMRCHPPIEYQLSDHEKDDIQLVTQLINDRTTQWIIDHPEDYFWFHNRFKVHPAEQHVHAEELRKIIAARSAT